METQGFQKLGKKTFHYLCLRNALPVVIFFIIGVILSIVSVSGGVPSADSSFLGYSLVIVLILFVLLALFGLLRAFVIYSALKYKIDASSFSLQKGILGKVETSVPFRQIQDIDIEQGLSRRMIGVCDLVILTAGHEDKDYASEDQSEIVLSSIEIGKAHELKEYLLSKTNSAGMGGASAAPADQVPPAATN